MNRLDSLSKDIESATEQNTKLSIARDNLLEEILKLHQKSIDLNRKNESLIRSIAEKENQISAFMYEPAPVVGVTLYDQPYTLPPPTTITPITEAPPIDPPRIHHLPKKEPGIFRQISLRLSNRKRRQHEENTATSLNISDPITSSVKYNNDSATITPIPSSSEPLLHPAAVVTSSLDNNKKSE